MLRCPSARIIIGGLALILLAPLAAPAGPIAPRRSILVLVGDDHGRHAGCYGDPTVKTPHLDKLAADGVRFSHAFAAVSSCSPSRSVILSGLYNHANGQYGLAHAEHDQHTHAWVRGLPLLLGQAGYRTGIIGKYHLQPRAVYPFESEAFDGLGGNRDVAAMADRARAFLRADDPRPFFLYVGFADPHRAAVGFGNDRSYRDVAKHSYSPEDVRVPPFLPDRPEVRRDLADYYESVGRLDRGVGLMLEALEESGRAGETLVIYLSDNGMPFPGAKTNLYDAGIRLPLLVRHPSPSRRGLVNDAMVSWVDVTPTLLDWAGLKPPYPLPGRSFLPILEQEHPSGWDEVFASHTFHEVTMYYPMRAVRTRRHKLIWNLAPELTYPHASDLWGSPTWQSILRSDSDDPRMGGRRVRDFLHRPAFELYDLQADPDELSNLASDPSQGGVLADLKARLLAMMESTKDPWLITLRQPPPAPENRPRALPPTRPPR
jgi:N-sulfoglucosamine sulfohydrolase